MDEKPVLRVGFWAKVLAVAFFLLAVMGWLRFEQALQNWNLLVELGAWPGPFYIAVTGIAWGLVGLVPFFGLLRRKSWAPAAARLAAFFFVLTYWVDKLWIDRSSTRLSNWPFALGASLIWLGYTHWVVSRRQHSERSYQG